MIKVFLNLLALPFLLVFYILKAFFRLFVSAAKKDVNGKIVLITGAGSGIGQKMCVEFAKLGCKVVGVDISSDGLKSTEDLMINLQMKSKWRCYKCDISEKTAVYETAELIKTEVGDVDILVNNAGIVTGGDFLDCKDEKIIKTMNVNCISHFWTLKAFLPRMIEKNSGHIVTVASAAGLFGMPRLVDYCSSKFAAVGLSESLDMEMKYRKKTGVHVTTVCPFYIDTGMFKGVHSNLIPIIKADDAVSAIMEGVLRNESHIILPKITKLSYFFKGMMSNKMLYILGEKVEVMGTMESFKGRN